MAIALIALSVATPAEASVRRSASLHTVTAGSPTTTTTLSELQRKKQRNDQQTRRNQNGIASLRRSSADVTAAMEAIDARLAASQSKLAAAQAAVTQAQEAADQAEAEVAAAQAKADDLQEQVRQMAVNEYVSPPSGLAMVLASGNFSDAHDRQAILRLRAEHHAELLKQQRDALHAVEASKASADRAASAAKGALANEQHVVADLEAAHAEQAQLVAALDQRLDAALAESAALAAVNQQLSVELVAEQQRLRDEAERRRAAQASAAASLNTTRKSGSSTTTTTAAPRAVPPSLYTLDDMELVGGIYVNKDIAGDVGRLLAAASAAGLTLTGGGFRDAQAQIQTRMANCGTSDYAIYDMPASECSPPTARPGTSMHEQGRAIDFQCSGVLIQSHDDACWVWLNDHAADYGLFNLASEPWHWSTNGN